MGSAPSAARLITRQDLKPEKKINDTWILEKAKASCIQNAVGLGMDPKTLEEMLDRRAQLAQADFCKERIYQFPAQNQLEMVNCLALYGLYSGFKFQSRKVCQDRVLIKEIHLKNGKSYLMLGIFDGHGTAGEHCSGFVVNNIYKYMEQYLNKYKDDIHKALVKTFAKTDRMLQKFSRSNQDCNVLLSGTTATCVLVPSKGFEKSTTTIHVAHLGDSKAAVSSANAESRKQFGVLDLTLDHNFEDSYESRRAVSKGGVVERIVINGLPQGPLRVFHPTNRVRPGLAVSRSFGDVEAHRVGVSSDPDILHLELKEHEDVIILASDGIWDMLSGSSILEHLDTHGWNVASFEKLILECARRWIYSRTGVCDDLSIIVFRLNHSAPKQDSEQKRKQSAIGPADVKEKRNSNSNYLAPPPPKQNIDLSSSPSQSDVPKPKSSSQEVFDISDDKFEMLAESPTQTVTDEQKIEKASLRRSTLKNIAEVVVDEFKINEPEIDEDILAALETNSLPAFDKGYMNELDAEFSVNTEASSLRSDQYVPKSAIAKEESLGPNELL